MYLMYADESGDTGLIASPTRYFILCGLVIHELRWRHVMDELLDFRMRWSPKTGQDGSLSPNPKHDPPNVQETTTAQS